MAYEEITDKFIGGSAKRDINPTRTHYGNNANQCLFYVATLNQRRFSVVSTLAARCVNIRKITGEEWKDMRKKRNRELQL